MWTFDKECSFSARVRWEQKICVDYVMKIADGNRRIRREKTTIY